MAQAEIDTSTRSHTVKEARHKEEPTHIVIPSGIEVCEPEEAEGNGARLGESRAAREE